MVIVITDTPNSDMSICEYQYVKYNDDIVIQPKTKFNVTITKQNIIINYTHKK